MYLIFFWKNTFLNIFQDEIVLRSKNENGLVLKWIGFSMVVTIHSKLILFDFSGNEKYTFV